MSASKKLGFKCGVTGKRRFKSHAHALDRAQVLLQKPNSPSHWRTYSCEFCGGWHLTKK